MSEPKRPPLVAGKYHIQDRLGQGAHGTVYRATHVDLDEDVALKILNHELATDPQTQKRFLREVKLSTSFVHKYAVQLRDFGREPNMGCLYFTMDLVKGPTLLNILENEGPVDERTAIHLMSQLLEALEEAHRAGIVHRDLKPANLIVTAGPDKTMEIRVLDFGVAKAVSSTRKELFGGQSELTITGTLVGTLNYMSPEQAQGLEIDARSDLYSVGVILYELLSGVRPTVPDPKAPNKLQSYLYRLTTVAPSSLKRAAPHVTRELDAVVMKALHKNPDKRWPSAKEFRKALKQVPPTKASLRRAKKQEGLPAPPTRSDRLTPSRAHTTLNADRARSATRSSKKKDETRSRKKGKDDTRSRTRPKLADPSKPAKRKSHSKRTRKAQSLPEGIVPGPRKGEYVNERDGSILVWIPPGTYVRGAKPSADGTLTGLLGKTARLTTKDHPPHEVTLTRGVFMGKTPVTWKQFRRFCLKKGRKPPTKVKFPSATKVTITEQHPAVMIDWNAAQAYCRWAKLRLPTEAEWEYAARGDDRRAFPWGPEGPSGKLLNWAGHPFFGDKATSPVGQFPRAASPFGCLDMAGNVWEWVADWYGDYGVLDARTDPKGPRGGKARVVRGGSWQSLVEHCQASRRFALAPNARHNSVGFRVCRSG